MGETSTSANIAALLAQALHLQGRDAEAVAVSDVEPAEDDVSARVHLYATRARALAGAVAVLGADRRSRPCVALVLRQAQDDDHLQARQ